MEFEWDADKELENRHKHGVSFEEALETFLDPFGFALNDCRHSEKECRYYWIGKDKKGRVLTVRYTHRQLKIRIIGAAEWREFRRLYDEKTKN